jgi:C4-type Zn-finger protein
MLTNEHYVAKMGNHCPVCEGRDIDSSANGAEYGEDWCSVSVECENCGATWKDIYKLTGFSDLETNT